MYIQILKLISKGVLRATLRMICFVLADDLHVNILKFVAGDGTIVQPASINICEDSLLYSGRIRTSLDKVDYLKVGSLLYCITALCHRN